MQPAFFALGVLILALVWLGPLPALAPRSFSAHMTMHMSVVAVAAPLLAIGLAGGRFDPSRRAPALFSPIPASVVELFVVWGWHAPALHHAARASVVALWAEQSTFLISGLLVWLSACGGYAGARQARAGTGVLALLMTSMHMTLLGALFALSPRPLYGHAAGAMSAGALLDEQHLGGAIMLTVGGAVYLAGGLWLSFRLLAARPPRPRGELA